MGSRKKPAAPAKAPILKKVLKAFLEIDPEDAKKALAKEPLLKK